MKYKLSVIIPTYNRKNRLEKSLAMYTAENISEIEYIILDNHSTDDTEEYLLSLMEKNQNIKYFRNPQNLGYNRNLYRGYLEATSNWITVLADDDEMEYGYFYDLLSIIENDARDECAIIVSPLKFRVKDNEERIYSKYDSTTRIHKGLDAIKSVYMETGAVPGFTFNKNLINQDVWRLDNSIYPQIRIAVYASLKHDVIYFVPKHYIVIPEGDSVMIRVADAMKRPLDYGVIERFNILLDVQKELSGIEGRRLIHEMSPNILGWAAGVFKAMNALDKVYSMKYFKSLLEHDKIKSSPIFWLVVVNEILKNKNVNISAKIFITKMLLVNNILSIYKSEYLGALIFVLGMLRTRMNARLVKRKTHADQR